MPRFPLRDAPFIVAGRMFAEPVRRSEMLLFMLDPEAHSAFTHEARSINGRVTQVVTVQRQSSRTYLEMYLDRSECAFFQAKIENKIVFYEAAIKGHPYDLLCLREKWLVFQDLFEELELAWFTWSNFLVTYSQGKTPLFRLSGRKTGSKQIEGLGGSILREKIDWKTGTMTLPAPHQNGARRRGEPAPTQVWTVFVSYVGDPERSAERERQETQANLTQWLIAHMGRFPDAPLTRAEMFELVEEEFPRVKYAVFLRAWAAALATIRRDDRTTRWGRSGRRYGFRVRQPAEQ